MSGSPTSRHGAARAALALAALLAVALPGAVAGQAMSEVALLPMQNRTEGPVPEKEILRDLAVQISLAGVPVLDDARLQEFLRRHRMRWVGGINPERARALQDETGVSGVVITSLDLFRESSPPKVALTARLVSTGPEPRILWMDRYAVSGDGSPGFLGLGLVDDVDVLLRRALPALAASLASAASEEGTARPARPSTRPARRFRPKIAFQADDVAVLGGDGARIALLPLATDSALPYAGEIVTDLVLLELVNAGADVLEPGIVRQALLENRLIQPEGPSLPQADVIHVSLEVDRILYGEVAEYRESGGGTLYPVVDFSIRALDTRSRQVIWSSISHTTGNEGVFFFDAGRIPTAHELTWRMAGALVARLDRPPQERTGGR